LENILHVPVKESMLRLAEQDRIARQTVSGLYLYCARNSHTRLRWLGTSHHRLSLSFRASKWNPIEHRLFSQINRNWAAEPLDNYEKALKFIRTTTTTTGLKVNCASRYHLLPHWRQGLKTGTRSTLHPTETCSTKMELHHLTPDVNYFLGSYLGPALKHR
jgi:hypothetical protein